jgi:hypothetical protein
MSLACAREGQDCTHSCFQLSTIDEGSDVSQALGGNLDQKECGFDAMALRKILIGT